MGNELRSQTGGETRLDDEPLQLLFGDLHNHTLLSDGAGDPRTAFAMMRAAGLDFAALTDHASIPHHALETAIDAADYPDDEARALARLAPHSLDDEGWLLTGELADEADEPGVFTAFRGFEWTEPWLGHANVWFSEQFQHVHTPARIDGLHRWLADQAPEALFGYNHPGREPGLFADYSFDPVVAPRMVSLEVFNRYSDFLFEGWLGGGHSSPDRRLPRLGVATGVGRMQRRARPLVRTHRQGPYGIVGNGALAAGHPRGTAGATELRDPRGRTSAGGDARRRTHGLVAVARRTATAARRPGDH